MTLNSVPATSPTVSPSTELVEIGHKKVAVKKTLYHEQGDYERVEGIWGIPEIVITTLKNLKAADLHNTRLACKQWKALSDHVLEKKIAKLSQEIAAAPSATPPKVPALRPKSAPGKPATVPPLPQLRLLTPQELSFLQNENYALASREGYIAQKLKNPSETQKTSPLQVAAAAKQGLSKYGSTSKGFNSKAIAKLIKGAKFLGIYQSPPGSPRCGDSLGGITPLNRIPSK